MLGLTGKNNEFFDFLCSAPGERMLQENSISIHLQTGNLFHDNFNTQKRFYDFLLNEQDENKEIIKKKTAYSKPFKTHLHQFLQSLDYDEIGKFDLYSDKNTKYLFYGLNSFLKPTRKPKKVLYTPNK